MNNTKFDICHTIVNSSDCYVFSPPLAVPIASKVVSVIRAFLFTIQPFFRSSFVEVFLARAFLPWEFHSEALGPTYAYISRSWIIVLPLLPVYNPSNLPSQEEETSTMMAPGKEPRNPMLVFYY